MPSAARMRRRVLLNAARSHEIDVRKWRNDMCRTMLVLKGG